MLSVKEKEFLLKLARSSIKEELSKGHSYIGETMRGGEVKPNLEEISPALSEPRGVFVTLFKGKVLRGCIGYIEPIKPLYQAVMSCAKSAAFDDPRFSPVEPAEFFLLRIEISVLSEPQVLEYENTKNLLQKLNSNMGIIIQRKMAGKVVNSATFLPQVWKELQSKEEFLSQLCLKAGLSSEEWKNEKLEVFSYTVERFSEEDYLVGKN